ncbi:iron-sulfur cluster assembly protein [Halodesulfurarchaeum sp. HSR-GB]|uniref:iron-sulfur cluster assembly protein n=1 Tax=Halodesulfurarchaeum sp. HSR-GB TaxID=3074077 RepID=UPI002857381A|nr:iron-sulfur cluster assembly protein [Halodesulfurarchaeum sp. HSR-GB]MDR5656532.1 iron-sulfur cluster assembly protein [Halodesulfurarchaeum sp. HSR-GB]
MAEEPTEAAVEAAVDEVTHPEIDATLTQLGMINGIEMEGETATVTLALPMLNIPDQVKNILVGRLREAVEGVGAEFESEIAVMTDAQREQFFQLEQQNWSGGIDGVDGPEGEADADDDTADPPF